MTPILFEHRCVCGRLLFKGALRSAWIQIKCRRCGELAHFSARYTRTHHLPVMRGADDSYLSGIEPTVVSGVLVFRDEEGLDLQMHQLWVAVDELWRCTTLSEGFAELAGTTPTLLLGRKIFEVLSPDSVVEHREDFIGATVRNEPFVLEDMALASTPQLRMRMHAVPHAGVDGECCGYTLIFEG